MARVVTYLQVTIFFIADETEILVMPGQLIFLAPCKPYSTFQRLLSSSL
jgi:hypothetical protein